MKIISNLDSVSNHFSRIKELVLESDKISIVSPFLMGDFNTFFNDLKLDSLNHIHLITTLKPKSFDQISKANSLMTFVDLPIFNNDNVDFKISINNRLHGKIYIFKKSDNPFKAIITSANFTDSGLSYNHEWGIEISDLIEIEKLESSIIKCIEIDDITKADVYKLVEVSNSYLEQKPDAVIREIDLDLSSYLNINLINHFDDSVNYWLKPIGVTEHTVEPSRKFNEIEFDLHFSKLRPTGVKINDILICYGVGTGKILSIYKATTLPIKVSDEEIEEEDWMERWPWYIKGENLTITYGTNWSNYNFNIGLLANEYLNQNTNNHILANGSKSLGGLNWGKDKLRLSTGFAKFMIEKVYTKNK
ncbi:restriction endonuclease PLD domain-containing protein [Confluentibacter sediminis]|uniref:restriction endonuclease PLD domain-containing protein n=1 Tax=Confluentibacter sediminis TaxID=2219045 RepID=UPI000DAEA260|nr:restriction endonuclease PLD domain-containing protein [Confluentibacter sediminis]